MVWIRLIVTAQMGSTAENPVASNICSLAHSEYTCFAILDEIMPFSGPHHAIYIYFWTNT
jgi:hypothetical protein